MNKEKIDFENLSYEEFKKLAQNEKLSKYEKIGFPDSYREGKEIFIFEDWIKKLTNLNKENQNILDIGCRCSDLPLMLIGKAKEKKSKLFLMDSKEMLDQLPNEKDIFKISAFFPECKDFIKDHQNKFDVIIVYSVLHYVFNETNLFNFIDNTLKLLNNNGQLLIGDIPNISMRKRFFSSPTGINFHKNFMKTNKEPEIKYNTIEEGKIDDSVIISIILRARNQGFHGYILPQDEKLPMANRREDILIIKP